MTGAAGVLVAARGAGRRYSGRVALAPIDLEVRAGESVALLGPNGAGKTTLLTLLAGAAEATRGDDRARRGPHGLGAAAPRALPQAERAREPAPVRRARAARAPARGGRAAARPGRPARRRRSPGAGAVGRQRAAPERRDRPRRRSGRRVPRRADGEPRPAPARRGCGSSCAASPAAAAPSSSRRRTSRRRTPRPTASSCCRRAGSCSPAPQEAFWQQAGVENSSTGAFERAFVRFLDLQAEPAS